MPIARPGCRDGSHQRVKGASAGSWAFRATRSARDRSPLSDADVGRDYLFLTGPADRQCNFRDQTMPRDLCVKVLFSLAITILSRFGSQNLAVLANADPARLFTADLYAITNQLLFKFVSPY